MRTTLTRLHLPLLFAIFVFSPNTLKAQDQLVVGIGAYDILDNETALDFRAEYRPGSIVFLKRFRPFLGLELTSEGSLWAGGGLLYDWEFKPDWFLTPSLGAGFYARGSSDLDLENALQFRSQLEISYAYGDAGERVGLSFSHISNAHLGDDNPGTEVLSLSWHLPF